MITVLSPSVASSLAPSLRSFEAALEGLEELELYLRDWRCPEEGFELENARAPFLVRILEKARNVRHLSIGCYSILHDDLIGKMARHCVFTSLETCKLSYFRLRNASDLGDFLGPSSVALKGLTLSRIMLLDEDVSWADLFRHFASDSALQALEWMHLTRLFTNTGSRLGLNGGMGQEELLLGISGINGATQNRRTDLLASIELFSEGSWGPSLAFSAGVSIHWDKNLNRMHLFLASHGIDQLMGREEKWTNIASSVYLVEAVPYTLNPLFITTDDDPNPTKLPRFLRMWQSTHLSMGYIRRANFIPCLDRLFLLTFVAQPKTFWQQEHRQISELNTRQVSLRI